MKKHTKYLVIGLVLVGVVAGSIAISQDWIGVPGFGGGEQPKQTYEITYKVSAGWGGDVSLDKASVSPIQGGQTGFSIAPLFFSTNVNVRATITAPNGEQIVRQDKLNLGLAESQTGNFVFYTTQSGQHTIKVQAIVQNKIVGQKTLTVTPSGAGFSSK